ncbi:NAD(+) diphosphatase [Solwaraspora sp. WMMD1047]|uniref:NAD(+) diphosphatase n=1 Tax=Solwaraspora sp. WMMD1047 TaxID=3016102 RepID=UPI002417A5DF|nr:NAD(+) diphosphatase [Solwaraspora sp. WMMD1047]MDG4833201.1 NAD(+) diphosphatase [Solwaraspora sp. WMMD1047]
MTGPGRPAPPLARSTLDRAAHRRADREWLDAAWPTARVLVVDVAGGGRALVTTAPDHPRLVLLEPKVAPDTTADRRLFLGVEPDGVAVFAVDAPLPEVPDTRGANLRQVGHLLSDRDAGLLTTAVALANWHALHAYSSLNGLPTTVSDGGWTRLDDGGRQVWPRTDPAMIVLLNDGVPGPDGRCLLANNAAWPPAGDGRRFSCLAGYVEPGESAEAAVIREVDEEVGLPVSGIEYQGSQAWPFPGSLMLGFHARADPARAMRLDPAEIAAARWFTRPEIAAVLAGEQVSVGDGRLVLPPPSSIAYFLVRRWLDGTNLGP